MEASNQSGDRERLERPTLAGGELYANDIPFSPQRGPREPWWTFQSVAERLGPQAQAVRAAAAELTEAQIGRDGRVIVEATMLPNYLAASYYPGAMLEETGLTPVGSRPTTGTKLNPASEDEPDQPAKTFLLAADPPALERLEQLYTRETAPDGPLRLDALKFTSLQLEGPDDVLQMGHGEVPLTQDGRFVFEAVIHPQLAGRGEPDPAATVRAREDFAAYADSLGGRINDDFIREEGGMSHVPVLLPQDAGAIREAARFAQLRVLRPMPPLRPTPEVGEILWDLAPLPDGPVRDGRRIAIFDGGVDRSISGLGAWVREQTLTDRPEAQAHREHGTAVTSAALFGPLTPGEEVPVPHAGVDHYRVWPLPRGMGFDAELPWVLEQIEDVISTGDYKVAVITLAPALTVDDAEPHVWTATLDRLAAAHDVVFVVAAGNNGELEEGLNRILVPADLINGLSVGSCSSPSGLAVRDDYSCIGPGRPGARTAPTGVHFGGNFDAESFGAVVPGGAVAAHEGTSMSAPVVARGIAELDALLDGRASANLLRTMAVHLAERPLRRDADREGSTTRDVGYGRFPASYRLHLEHRSNDVTIVYEGYVRRRQRIALDIPIPDDVFDAAPTHRFAIRWTLGFFSPIEPANPVEYSAAGIQVVFRPNAQRFSILGPEGNTVNTADLRRPEDRDMFATGERLFGWRLSELAASDPQDGVAPEVVQRQQHGKWEGVVRMDKNIMGKRLHRPRLDFHMLVREGGELMKEAEDLRYALVVSLTAPTSINLYDRTTAAATLLTPLTVTVPVLVETA